MGSSGRGCPSGSFRDAARIERGAEGLPAEAKLYGAMGEQRKEEEQSRLGLAYARAPPTTCPLQSAANAHTPSPSLCLQLLTEYTRLTLTCLWREEQRLLPLFSRELLRSFPPEQSCLFGSSFQPGACVCARLCARHCTTRSPAATVRHASAAFPPNTPDVGAT